MEKQAYHIQTLLINELERCKGKGDEWVEAHIEKIQEAYQEGSQEIHQPMDIDKGKQKEGVIQDEDILLYKPYNISSKES